MNGKHLEALEAMQDAGREVPVLDKRPSLTGFFWLWEAFIRLNSCRQLGMSAGPIPWTATQQYADTHGFTPEETYMLHQVIAHVDEVYLKHLRDQQQSH